EFAKPAKPTTLELFDVTDTGSAVLRLADPAKVREATEKNDDKALRVLRDAGAVGLIAKDWELRSEINPHTLKDVRKRLLKKRLARQEGRRWFAAESPTRNDKIVKELET